MKNRMGFTPTTQSPQKAGNTLGNRPESIAGDQMRAGGFHVGRSEAWRAWETANHSEFFNWFLFMRLTPRSDPAYTCIEDWIYFQDHSWELGARTKATLADRMPHFRANPAMRIVIGGVASQPGDIAYGMRLALRRVLSVRTYLLAQGIDPDRIGIAIRGPGWRLAERAGAPRDPTGPSSEYRLQVTDPHWMLARN